MPSARPAAKTTKAAAAKPAEPNDSADQQAAEAAADPEEDLAAYLQHRLEVLERLPKEEDRPKNIYARLAQINGFIGMIKKTGYNDFHKYRFAKESDLVEEVRPMLSAYGIWIEQGLATGDDGTGLVPHQRLGQYKKNDGTTVESLTAITKRFRFVWWNPAGRNAGEAPAHASGVLETTDWVYFMGYGEDNGDKGYYKAETGAVKYFLMKTFMIATGDDPEGDTKTDRRAETREAGGGSAVQPTRAGGRPAAPGGRQQDTSAPQQRRIGELLRVVGITSTTAAITKLEELTGKTINIPDPEDMAGALTAFLAGLPGPEAGEVVQKLSGEANAKLAASKEGDEAKAGDKPKDKKDESFTDDEATTAETDPAGPSDAPHRPAAADFVEDEGTIPGAID